MSAGVLFVVALAAFVLWHFLPQAKARAPQPAPKYRLDPRISSANDEWEKFAEERCESPAEVAFLRAMIAAFDMQPANGSLISGGMRLDFQAVEGRYRVDFLVNEWLVVEIDGAAYHSSPEAKARDQERDRHFESLRYAVLRIPAKLVFETPLMAIEKVNEALAVGKPAPPVSAPPEPESSGFYRLGQTFSAFGRSIGQTNELVNRARTTQNALAGPKRALEAETALVEAAIVNAKRAVALEDWKAENPELQASYNAHYAELAALFDGEPSNPKPRSDFHRFQPPEIVVNDDVNVLVHQGYEELLDRREDMLMSARLVLRSEPRLRTDIERVLVENGREDLWVLIR